MRVHQLGDDDPEVAIVGGIHGDEPCGVRAVESLVEADPPVDRPVALVIANEEALARNVRYVEEDLNRCFPGDADGDTHERRLAARLSETIAGCETLSLHSTQSYRDIFAIVNSTGPFQKRVCPHISVDSIVEAGAFDSGRLFASVSELVEVECGMQGTDRAAGNAEQVAREFLGAVGALPGRDRPRRTDLPVYRLTRRVPKARGGPYEVYVSNFEEVPSGEVFASIDGVDVVAEKSFYPVLMSPYGYEDVFGYAAERVGTVGDTAG